MSGGPPFGVPELLEAVAGATRVLDAGCGGGRLTVALAGTGAEVTGIDTSAEQLEQARARAAEADVELRLQGADFNESLPFADSSFDAVTSRLSLMIARDPVTTLREVGRVLAPGGRVATALWASLPDNPWFAIPRQAIASVLGDDRASFARAFARLGEPADAAEVHRAAGLEGVHARLLRERLPAADAAGHWRWLARENGHFRRIDAGLGKRDRAALLEELAARLAPFHAGDGLLLPRTLVLVTARRAGTRAADNRRR